MHIKASLTLEAVLALPAVVILIAGISFSVITASRKVNHLLQQQEQGIIRRNQTALDLVGLGDL